MSRIVEDVIFQHAENVCALWLQRQRAVDAPHYSYTDLVNLDNRIEANLDGLRIAGVNGLPFVVEMMKADDEGAYFAAALLTLEQGRRDMFDGLVDQAIHNEQIHSEVGSALAWAKPELLKGIVNSLLNRKESAAIILGLRTCAAHYTDPNRYLRVHIGSSDSTVRSAAIAVCANLGLKGFKTDLLNMGEGETEEERFELGRAAALLGAQRIAQKILYPLAIDVSEYSTQSVDILAQLHDANYAKSLLKTLDALGGRERDVVKGFGLIGDPLAMNWLIDRIESSKLGRHSGSAITTITGVDLEEEGLELPNAPEGKFSDMLNDDSEDDNVLLSEDEDLPWPDPVLVRSWWESSAKLPEGRYFLNGQVKLRNELQQVLLEGMQRQRNIAATSLALLGTNTRYLDTRLPTNKQALWVR